MHRLHIFSFQWCRVVVVQFFKKVWLLSLGILQGQWRTYTVCAIANNFSSGFGMILPIYMYVFFKQCIYSAWEIHFCNLGMKPEQELYKYSKNWDPRLYSRLVILWNNSKQKQWRFCFLILLSTSRIHGLTQLRRWYVQRNLIALLQL